MPRFSGVVTEPIVLKPGSQWHFSDLSLDEGMQLVIDNAKTLIKNGQIDSETLNDIRRTADRLYSFLSQDDKNFVSLPETGKLNTQLSSHELKCCISIMHEKKKLTEEILSAFFRQPICFPVQVLENYEFE